MTNQKESATEYREKDDVVLVLQDRAVRYWNHRWRWGKDSAYALDNLQNIEVRKELDIPFLIIVVICIFITVFITATVGIGMGLLPSSLIGLATVVISEFALTTGDKYVLVLGISMTPEAKGEGLAYPAKVVITRYTPVRFDKLTVFARSVNKRLAAIQKAS